MMPFVTEELYQRLPASASKCGSIVIAPYPESVVGWQNAVTESRMDMLKLVIGGLRSQMSQIGIKPNAKPVAFVYLQTEDDLKFIRSVAHHVVTLAKLDSLQVVDSPPNGNSLIVSVVSDKCSVFIDAAGLVDFQAELCKLDKKKALIEKSLEAMEKKKSLAGYEQKVPAEVRAENDAKQESLKGQLVEIENAHRMLTLAAGNH